MISGRSAAARILARAGSAALRRSEILADDGNPTLAGDRWVEWSFCMARLASGPGRTLDFGADIGFLSLAAAQRGHEVTAFDRLASSLDYRHERVSHVQADILDRPPLGEPFDQIINCSSVEHVGLGGRYGSPHQSDGDLRAMETMRQLLAPGGRMLLTLPIGRDMICEPHHRIYGTRRLNELTDGYEVVEAQYWRKNRVSRLWAQVPAHEALAEEGSARFYALGLFVLTGSGTTT